MRTAIVTGASGFIGGAYIKYLLSRGNHVTAVSRNIQRLNDIKQDNLTLIEADFEDYPALSEYLASADIFYHFAWDGPSGSKTEDHTIQLRNAKAACDALLLASKIGCHKFMLAGTVAEVEVIEHIDRNICNPRGTCIYATAKLAAEMMCKTLAVTNGIEFNCGLFANIFGPGDMSKPVNQFYLE